MQLPGESIGIIADDLTGACDTALQFFLEGDNTRILLDYTAASESSGFQTLVVNTNSRHMEQFDAVAAIRKSLKFLKTQAGLERFYKKIDSTLRGHIAQECLGMLDQLRWQAAVVAPAYPDEGRRTVGGYQLVRGMPVEQTEIARDPLCPVTQSHIPTLLGETSSPDIIGYIPLSTVLKGAGPILMALQEQIEMGKKLVVVDSCSDTDLEQLSLAINKMPSDINVLPCGSAGLAKALTKKWIVHTEQAKPSPTMTIERSPMLMVIGTASDTTRRQVMRLMDYYTDYAPDGKLEIVQLTPGQILGFEPVEADVERMITLLRQQATVVLTTSFNEDNVNQTIALAHEHNLKPEQASDKASELLASLTQRVLNEVQARLLLSGGETATRVCQELNARSLQIIRQVETSIPLMIDDQGRWIITKSGSFGDPMILLNIFKTLQQMEMKQEETVYE